MTEWRKEWHLNLKNFRYSKLVDYVYFKPSYVLNIKQFNIDDLFVIELFPVQNSMQEAKNFTGNY